MKRKGNIETSDICNFCQELWGSDRRSTCNSVCTCAAYANQDHVYQRELTIGLPSPKSWSIKESSPSGDDWWKGLSNVARGRVADKMARIVKESDPVLSQLLVLLMMGYSMEETCEELSITKESFEEYVKRLKRSSRDILGE